MIRTIQLYIGNERVELFGDETISITDSIKNAKDIAKVFTTFSQQFTVPASKNNNRIFKHFYNFDIDSPYDFDARKKTAARIELNFLPFKSGRVKLDGVDLKNNAPSAYRITFYGSVVDLKDLIGEDKLPTLSDFNGVTKPYDINSLISDLTQNATGDYVLSLITAGQRLYYDSENGSQGSGNIHYDGTTAQGLKPQQLKYAVKLSKIIDAIESEYSGITFASNSFFKPSQANDLDDLYMWLHRKNDTVEIVAGANQVISFENDYTNLYFNIVDNVFYPTSATGTFPADAIYFYFTPATGYTDVRYDIILYKNGEIADVGYKQDVSGDNSVQQGNTVTIPATPFQQGDEFQIFIRTYDEAIVFDQIQFRYSTGVGGSNYFWYADVLSYDAGFEFSIQENMPEMKIIDFLSGLFQLFNLVAYVNDSGEIVTQTLDEFYRKGGRYDISQYIDVSKSSVDSALPFKEIFFKYKDTKTILAEQHLQEISNVEWGGVEYTSEADLSGDTYKVEPPFHHAKYEKLLDSSNTNFSTDTQVGYFVTDNEEAYLGSPLLFYIVPQTSAVRISYTKDGNLVNSPALSGTINMPSNSKSFNAATSQENIHFNVERNEFTGTLDFEDTLFKRYYEKYITSVFNRRNRLTKVTAYLPVSILRELELSDTIIINGRSYIINSMNINLNTGKTNFELLNKYNVSAIWEQVEDTWSTVDSEWSTI